MRRLILFIALAFSLVSNAQVVGSLIAVVGQKSGGGSTSIFMDISAGIARGPELDLNESNAQDIYWKQDGTMFWIIGATGDDVTEWTPITNWRVAGATETAAYSVSTNGGEAIPTSIEWIPDGSGFLICGLTRDRVMRYDVSTNWDITTASFTSESSAINNLFNIALNDTGTFIQLCVSDYFQNTYTMSTPYDPTTLSALVDSEDTGSPVKFSNFGFNNDGTQAWGADENSGIVYTWDIATPYDWINTRSNEQTKQTVYYSNLRGMTFNYENPLYFYLCGAGSNVEMKEHRTVAPMDLGPEKAVNASFDSTGGWTAGAGWTIAGTGSAVLTSATGNQILKNVPNMAVVTGETYLINLDISAETGTGTNPTTLQFIVEDQNLEVNDWFFYTDNVTTGNQVFQTYGRDSDTMTVDYFGVKKINN